MICPSCDADILDCECSLIDGDCIGVDGSGNATPLTLRPRFDADPDNLASCSVAGLLAKLPPDVLDPPRVQAFHPSNQSTTSDDPFVSDLDSENYDTDGMHGTGSRITFITPGIYVVTFEATFAANTTGDRSAYIRRNGKVVLAMQQKHALSATTFECGLSVTYQGPFEANDFVQGVVKQDSGGALNLIGSSGTNLYSPVLSAIYRRRLPDD